MSADSTENTAASLPSLPCAMSKLLEPLLLSLHDSIIGATGLKPAMRLEPLEIEQWLQALKQEENLANPTLDKIRRVMSLVFKHGQRYGLIPRTEEANPMRFVRCKTTSGYEAMILTPNRRLKFSCTCKSQGER